MIENRNVIREQAVRYHNIGFSVIPVGQDKKPLVAWKQYQTDRASLEQVEKWLQEYPGMNIGVVTGVISGVVVIDVEKEGNIEGYPPTSTARTGGGGWHLYYRHPGGVINNSTKKIASFTDVRGDGGYAVLPPSLHASGSRYEWITSPETGIAELPADLLAKITAAPVTNPEPTTPGEVVEGERNDAATRHVGKVLSHLPKELWQTAAWGSLKEWNATHAAPPLGIAELRSIFDSISKREDAGRSIEESASAIRQVTFTPFSLATLYQETFAPGNWAVQDLVPLGGITAVTGDSNSYKTFLTQSMAGSVVSGEKFLGHFPTTKGKVLIIDEENHRRVVLDRFKEMGVPPTDDLLFLSLAGIKLDNPEHLRNLRAVLEKEKPTLVILDSLVRLHNGEENSATEMAKAFSAMKKLIADDRAILFIHHHRKPQGFGKKSTSQSIRGSSDILAAVDCHISVDRKDTEVTIAQTKLRLKPELKPFKAALVPNGQGNIIFSYQGVDTSEEDQKIESYKLIKRALAEASDSMTVEDLLDQTGLQQRHLRGGLKDLVLSKEIEITSIGAHGVRYYGLPAASEPDDTNN